MARIENLLRSAAYGVLVIGALLILIPTTYQTGDLDPLPCGSPVTFQREVFEDDLVAGDVGEGRTWRRENAEGLASACDSQVGHRIALATLAGLLAIGALAVSVHAGKARQDP